MADKLRGLVTNIVNGDMFDLQITEVVEGDRDQYDETERIRIGSLDIEIEAQSRELEDFAGTDEEETTGTPEEASIETGRPDPGRFYSVRDPEDLEERLKGLTVDCTVLERNRDGEIIADVTVL